jgi:DNA-binding NarL/FixJ family response regulator
MSPTKAARMKVFIVDDSSAIVERLTLLLDDVPGVELVGHASDVSQAVQRIQEAMPDAVVLDLHMPGGTGLDVLRAVRPLQPALRVLICTNYPDSEYRQKCMSAGADYFLDKSTEFEKIPAILHKLMHKEAKTSPAAR